MFNPIQIKWVPGIFSEYGTQYICRKPEGDYYLSLRISKNTLVFDEPNSIPLAGDLMWMPITIPKAV